MSGVAEAKAAYTAQTFDAFDDDPPPPVDRTAADYISHLAGLRFRSDDPFDVWTFWALAPVETRWAGWACRTARDKDSGWLDRLEHVWVTQHGEIHQALVDVHTAAILQLRTQEKPMPATDQPKQAS